MADGHFPTLVSATRDANAAANPLFTQLTDGTDLATITAGGSLNVNISNASIVVTATDLDIRDLTHVSDSVKVGDGTDFLAIAADGSIAVTDNGGSLTVDGTVAVSSVIPGTGATNLGKAEDAAHTSGDVGVMPLGVRSDAGGSLVSADGDYSPLSINASGELRVAAAVTVGDNKAEDAAHTSGDTGSYVLAVRQDTLASSTSADGDYASFKTNAAGALYVSVSNASIAVTATDLDIRDLTHVSDSIRIGDGTDLANVTASGELNVLASAQPGVDIGDVTINNAAGAAAVNIQDGGNSITVDGTVTVTATDLDIRDLTLAQDAVKVSANSTANSATNPIFVKEADSVVSNEVHSYNTASAVASDATSNHDYTVTGTTFLLKQVKFATSGGGKIEIQTGPVASLVSLAVGFIPKEGGIVQIDFNPPKEVPVTSTGTVRVIRTNRQGAAQDVYSTIIGNDIP